MAAAVDAAGAGAGTQPERWALAQSTDSVLLIRPAAFCVNPQTASSNHFQSPVPTLPSAAVAGVASGSDAAAAAASAADAAAAAAAAAVVLAAQRDSDALAQALRDAGVDVHQLDDTPVPVKPDACFPNNWLSLHHNGKVCWYPMHAPNRRAERRLSVLAQLSRHFRIHPQAPLHRDDTRLYAEWFSVYETAQPAPRFCEGTGSLVFDHTARVVYACVSARTDAALVRHIAQVLGYAPCLVRAVDAQGREVYHTNVLLSVGVGWAVLCADAIADATERADVCARLERSGHALVHISHDQMNRFAGNVLQLHGWRADGAGSTGAAVDAAAVAATAATAAAAKAKAAAAAAHWAVQFQPPQPPGGPSSATAPAPAPVSAATDTKAAAADTGASPASPFAPPARPLRKQLLCVMSSTAYHAFTPAQRAVIERAGSQLVHVPVPTIECGGGSVRCMIAEIFLPRLHPHPAFAAAADTTGAGAADAKRHSGATSAANGFATFASQVGTLAAPSKL